ncbi:hypothetical protein ES703_30847 [subsurface metagenome]
MPPPNFTKKGKIYVPKHHSVADWDFEFGATNRSLSAVQYVSPPTSLRILEPTSADFRDTVLCRIAETQCLPQGEVRNWAWYNYIALMVACFRNQAPLGTANFQNCYYVHLSGTSARLYRYIGGVISLRDQTTCQTFGQAWAHYRVLFWNGLTPSLEEALCVNLYHGVGDIWTQEGQTMYDTDNSWKDSEINRIGFVPYSSDNREQYWDDTEIWGPAE